MRRRWLVAVTELAGVSTYTGGVGRRYAALIAELQSHSDLDIVVALVLRHGAKLEDPRAAAIENLTIRYTPGWARGPLAFLAGSFLVRREIRRHKPDLVFAPEWTGLASLIQKNVPLVTNLVTSARLIDEIEDKASGGTLKSLARRCQYWLEERQIRKSTGTVSISTAIADWNTRRFGELERNRVVANCIDVDHVKKVARHAPATSNGRRIVFVGRCEVRKGITDALDSFAILASEFPDLEMFVLGDLGHDYETSSEDALRSRLPRQLHDRVFFLGHQNSSNLYVDIASADIAMTPSRWEGFGNAALEVKACGTSLVATTGSGFDDFCASEVDCLLVPPADPLELAGAVRRLLLDKEFRVGIAAAGFSSVDSYRPSVIAPALRQAVEEVAFLKER